MILDDFASILQTNGIGTVGTDIFKGLLPDQPDAAVAVFMYSGQPPELSAPVDRPAFQVRVRDVDFLTGFNKTTAIQKALHGICESDIGGTHFLLIAANGSPMGIGRDANDRWEWTQNFYTMTRRN